jgi:hypothetical protein
MLSRRKETIIHQEKRTKENQCPALDERKEGRAKQKLVQTNRRKRGEKETWSRSRTEGGCLIACW